MTRFVWGGIGLLLGLLAGVAPPASAQWGAFDSTGVTEAALRRLATFDRAAALAVDPRGRLYVVDAGRATVVVLASTGERLQSVGGPGTRSGEFDTPSDVDPTNGLTVLVADAGNGRIQRFTEDGRFLEALPVGDSRAGSASTDASRRQPVFEAGRDGAGVGASGQPVAVVSTNANEVFAVDARDAAVVHWDAQRRFDRVIGGFGDGAGALGDPVALAVADQRLYVADRSDAAIHVFDLFGAYERRLQPVPTPNARALAVHDDALWIVEPERIVVASRDGRHRRTVTVDLPAPLVDVDVADGTPLLLTETALYVVRTR